MKRTFGTRPDIPDVRDLVYVPAARIRLPHSVDLRPHCPPVFDQLSLNSCSANAIGAAVWFDELRQHRSAARKPSRLFIYYNTRAETGSVHRNIPVSMRDGYKTVSHRGVCGEQLWPYRVHRYADKPTPHCYREAKLTRALSYYRVHRNLDLMRACLAEGHPFAFGLSVYQSFKSVHVARTGEVPMPNRRDHLLGGHALLAVGYHDRHKHFIVRNSWGESWGLGGYCMVPYDYILDVNMAWDFWTCWHVGK